MTKAVVVYVHGLWLGGGESVLLRRRLARAVDARCVAFSYQSVRGGLGANVDALRRYVLGINADTLHLVAHSMGGLLVLRLFEVLRMLEVGLEGQTLPPGRVVLLGSPVRGSRAAQRLSRAPLGLGRRMLGVTAAEGMLTSREPRWTESRDIGVIAGDLGLGLGRLLGPMGAGPNDGTVWVSETHLLGATAQLRLPVSHSGLLFSSQVAARVASFLRQGRF